MIVCFDLLKYANELDQIALGITNTVVRTIEKAYLQLTQTEEQEEAQKQIKFANFNEMDDHSVKVCEKHDLIELIDLSFQWLTALSRYPEGRREIQYTQILELVSAIATKCLPIIRTISETQIQDIIDNMAGFLKAFTQNKTKISHESKNIQEIET